MLDVTPEVMSVLSGKEDAKSTEFGGVCEPSLVLIDNFLLSRTRPIIRWTLTGAPIVVEMRFETGEEKLKDLERGTFVASGTFLFEKGKPVTVEYKLSKVVKGWTSAFRSPSYRRWAESFFSHKLVTHEAKRIWSV